MFPRRSSLSWPSMLRVCVRATSLLRLTDQSPRKKETRQVEGKLGKHIYDSIRDVRVHAQASQISSAGQSLFDWAKLPDRTTHKPRCRAAAAAEVKTGPRHEALSINYKRTPSTHLGAVGLSRKETCTHAVVRQHRAMRVPLVPYGTPKDIKDMGARR